MLVVWYHGFTMGLPSLLKNGWQNEIDLQDELVYLSAFFAGVATGYRRDSLPGSNVGKPWGEVGIQR